MTIGLREENGNPKGKIESYNFPDDAVAGKERPYSMVVHNIGGTGTYGCGIVNVTGNPGLIKFILDDQTINVNQGEYLRSYQSGPYCSRFTTSRQIIFTVPGTYKILLWGMYKVSDTWYYIPEAELTITVTEEEVTKSLWERFKEFASENPLPVAVAVGSVVIGGAVAGGRMVGRRREH